MPDYYTKPLPGRRSETTSKEARFQRQYEANELIIEEFFAADHINSFEELTEKLETEKNWPKNTLNLSSENKLTLYAIKENDSGRPMVKYVQLNHKARFVFYNVVY